MNLAATVFVRRPLTPAAVATLGALLVSAAGYGLLQMQIGTPVAPIIIVGLALALAAGVVATGWRWAPALGISLGVGVWIGVFATAYAVYHVQHPAEFGPFLAMVLCLGGATAAIVAGGAATWQAAHAAGGRQIAWLRPALLAIGGVALGTLIAAGLAAANPAAPASGTGGSPTVHVGVANFDQTAVIVPRGQSLHLVADSAVLHILANGAWSNGQVHMQAEPGAPILDQVHLDGGSLTVGPFATPGTYHILCTVHPGMTLTVFVP